MPTNDPNPPETKAKSRWSPLFLYALFLLIYFLAFFLPILSLTYLAMRVFFSLHPIGHLPSQTRVISIFIPYLLSVISATVVTHKIASNILKKLLCPPFQQPSFFKLAKILSSITIIFLTIAPPTILLTWRKIENLTQTLGQKEASKYVGAVKLDKFSAQFEAASSPASQYKRLVIKAQAKAKKPGNYTFRPLFYCSGLTNLKYTLWLNGNQVLQKDPKTKREQQEIFLPADQKTLTFAYEFTQLSFNPLYPIECTFNYQIVRLDRKKKPGILSQLGIKPEYIKEWEFAVSQRHDGENWRLPPLKEESFYQWGTP